jgi:hypothetical protein
VNTPDVESYDELVSLLQARNVSIIIVIILDMVA